MNSTQWHHRAIMNMDVVGYSAMTAADCPGTAMALQVNLHWITQAVLQFGGRIVDAVGDNIMAEFSDGRSAVRCALHLQQAERQRNRYLPRHTHIHLRIGICSGCILRVGGRLFGTPVNLASRLQGQAPTGGLLITQELATLASDDLRHHPQGDCESRFKDFAEPLTTTEVRVH